MKSFKYGDGSIGKNYLFVIIDDFNKAIPLEYLNVIVSSKLSKIKYKTNKFLFKDNINNLVQNNIIKLDTFYRISKGYIEF